MGAGPDFLQLALLHRTLARLCRARMPLGRALALVAPDMAGPLRAAVCAVAADVEAGIAVAEAYRGRAGAFPALYAALVEAGTAAGDLPGALDEIARDAALRADTAARLRRAVRYPLITAAAAALLGTLAALGLRTVILGFADIYAGLEVALPAPTRIALKLAALPVEGILAALAALGLLAAAAAAVIRRLGPAEGRARPALGVPLFGRMRLYAALASFSAAAALLVRRSIPLGRALRLAAGAADHARVRAAADAAASAAESGRGLSDALREAGLLPPSLAWLLAAGEGHGAGAAALDDVAAIYRARLSRAVDRALVLVGPASIAAVGAVILVAGGTVLAIFMPIMGLVSSFYGSVVVPRGPAADLGSLAVCLALGAAVIAFVSRPLVIRARLEFRARSLEVLAATVRREQPPGRGLAAALEDWGGPPRRPRRRARWDRRAALAATIEYLARGAPLSRALELGAPRFFPQRITEAVRAAEGGGDLAAALEAAAGEALGAAGAVHQASIPLLYFGAVFLVTALLGAFIYPEYLEIFEGLGTEPPTLALGAATVVAGAAPYLILAALGVLLTKSVARRVLGEARWAALVERALTAAPPTRRLALLRAGERLCRSLAPLVRAGVPLPKALRRAGPATGNPLVERSAEAAAAAVERGAPAEDALAGLLLPRFVRARAAAAAGTGADRLARALEALAGESGRQGTLLRDRLVASIYPATVFVMGALIFVQMRGHFTAYGAMLRTVGEFFTRGGP